MGECEDGRFVASGNGKGAGMEPCEGGGGIAAVGISLVNALLQHIETL